MYVLMGFKKKPMKHGKKVVKLWSFEVVVVKFLNFKDKSRILHTYREKKLQNEKIFVIEDFSEKTASIQKSLLQKAKDLRSQNKVAKVVHDKLIVYEKERVNYIPEAQGNP